AAMMADQKSSKFVWEEDDLVFPDDKPTEKYNEHHDERGRFSEGDSGGGGGSETQYHEGNPEWVPPKEADPPREYQVEGVKHQVAAILDKFPTEDAFVNAVRNAPVVSVDHKLDSQISNRSRTRSMEGLLSLISGYRSYPKYRNEGTLMALEDRIK